MMGGEGLKRHRDRDPDANYIAARLADHYPVLSQRGARSGRARCILDIRPLKAATGITEGRRQAPDGLRISTRQRCPSRWPAR